MTKLWNIVYVFVLFNSDIALPMQLSKLEGDIVDSLEDDDADDGVDMDGSFGANIIKVQTRPGT